MDWPGPGAQRLGLEKPSGACSYTFVKKPVRAQNTTQSISWRPAGSVSLLLIQKNTGLKEGKASLVSSSFSNFKNWIHVGSLEGKQII